MATSEMDYMNIGGGLIKTDSWITAVNNAKSYIIAIANGRLNNVDFKFSFVVPKEELSATIIEFLGGASHPSNQWYVALDINATSISTRIYHNGDSDGITVTNTFYYN